MADDPIPALESSTELPSMEEPADFWEKESVTNQLAKFDGGKPAGETMSMLVAVRVRPMWEKEVDAGDYSTVQVLEGKVVVVLDPWYDQDLNPNRAKEKRYAFDVVFDESINQLEVYTQTARGLVDGVLDGYNSSVFAYGATGAGKTHTMLGSLDQPGVMVNTLHDMFTRMKDSNFSDAKFKVTLSYMEIYNELIKDLLMPAAVDLKLNEDPARGMVVQGITEYGADSADEILELLHRGNMHRAVEPTAANQVSSRSHAVLQITVEQSDATAHVTGSVRIGKLSMVDLAGSERASKTDNTGQRLKEGANINRSLLALGNCITALADKSRKGHVPFRDSKMTRLLKDSLGGNCRTVMIANISPSHRQFEETINTLKYSNRAKNLKTQVARNVVSVSAHIAEYQRVIMELRNEVADLKRSLKTVKEGGESLQAPEFQRKQRSLDYVDNLEKQHMQELKDAILVAMGDRRRLLTQLTQHSQALSDARAAEGTNSAAAQGKEGADAAAQPPDSSAHAPLHSAIADVRRKLQQNQHAINELVATAVQRISSTERLQLLQLLVRGKFLEVMNEEMSTELEMRRALTTAAMAQGALPPALMNQAISTESWYSEHRAALDFHAKMAKTEMGGSLRAPSIAQLLDQNMVSPAQATATQNLGELVRPFTNHQKGGGPARGMRMNKGKEPMPLHDASRGGGSGGNGGAVPTGGGGGSSSGGGGGGPSLGGLLTDLIDDGDDDRHSSSAASERYGNSASSSLQSSRGPTRTGRAPGVGVGKGPPMGPALAGLKKRDDGRRGGSRERGDTKQSPNHSQPPTPAQGSREGRRSADGGAGGRRASAEAGRARPLRLNEPPERVKRFKPPINHNPANTQGGVRRLGQAPASQQGAGAGQLPAIGVVGTAQPPTAAQLASARAAAAARNPASRIQALGDAYGAPLPPGMKRPPGPPRLPIQRVGGAGALPSQRQRPGGGQLPYREGKFLPPAAPSARLAARLQQPRPGPGRLD